MVLEETSAPQIAKLVCKHGIYKSKFEISPSLMDTRFYLSIPFPHLTSKIDQIRNRRAFPVKSDFVFFPLLIKEP